MIEKPITTDKLYISTISNQSRWEKGGKGRGRKRGRGVLYPFYLVYYYYTVATLINAPLKNNYDCLVAHI